MSSSQPVTTMQRVRSHRTKFSLLAVGLTFGAAEFAMGQYMLSLIGWAIACIAIGQLWSYWGTHDFEEDPVQDSSDEARTDGGEVEQSTDETNRSKVNKHGNVVGRKVVVRETVDGFHGPLGSSTVENVTDELDGALADLEEGDVESARNRIETILRLCEVDR